MILRIGIYASVSVPSAQLQYIVKKMVKLASLSREHTDRTMQERPPVVGPMAMHQARWKRNILELFITANQRTGAETRKWAITFKNYFVCTAN